MCGEVVRIFIDYFRLFSFWNIVMMPTIDCSEVGCIKIENPQHTLLCRRA